MSRLLNIVSWPVGKPRKPQEHFATSVDGAKLDSGGGVYYLNDKGLPVGGVAANNPSKLQTQKSMMGGAGIFLNFVARVTTNA